MGFQLDQGGCDEEKLRGHLDVYLSHLVEKGQVLLHYLGESDGGYLHLVLRYQLKKQIEGPLKDSCLDVECHYGFEIIQNSALVLAFGA